MKKYTIIVIAIIQTILLSCSHFEDMNTDPTSSTKPIPAAQISAVQLRISGEREVQWRSTAYFHMGVSQMLSDGYTIGLGSKYVTRFDYFDYMWKSYYQMINNLQCAEEVAGADPDQINYVAVAEILKVYLFSQLTDTYGDIPYFEAVNGYNGGILYPKYDNQETIYLDFFKRLDKAVEIFDEHLPLEQDLIYNGDTELWKRFANSLRLRLAMRLVNVNEELAREQAGIAVKRGVMSNYTESAYVQHANVNVSATSVQEIRGNGFSQVINSPDQLTFVCSTYSDYLKKTHDPRLYMMFGIYGYPKGQSSNRTDFKSCNPESIECTREFEAVNGSLKGCPPGGTIFDAVTSMKLRPVYLEKDGQSIEVQPMFNILQIRRELVRFDTPSIYLAHSEVELWLAEAQEKGWNLTSSTAEDHFKNAVQSNFMTLQNILKAIPCQSQDLDKYLESIWMSEADKFKLINMQHYICNFFNGIEAFANWRRSGIPELVPANRAETDSELEQSGSLIPRRMAYPLVEMNYNTENVTPHLYNAKNFWGAPVWWDNSCTRGVAKPEKE